MSARDDILGRLRAASRSEAHPPAWRSLRRFDDLAGRFETSLVKAHGEALRAADPDEALDKLDRLLKELDAERVVVNDEPPLSGLDLAARWPGIEWRVVGRTGGDLRAFCAAADVGLSGASAALAETGSLVVESGPGRSRLATLLPPVHIALVSTACLTADLFSWAETRRGDVPACLTLISGPSKTADIEQTLTIGAHGPVRFIAILYGD